MAKLRTLDEIVDSNNVVVYEETNVLSLDELEFPRIEVLSHGISNFSEVGLKTHPLNWFTLAGYLRYTNETIPGKEQALYDIISFLESTVAKIYTFNEDKYSGNPPTSSFEKIHRNWSAEYHLELMDNMTGFVFEFALEDSSFPIT